jgi:hypothetical protein
MYVVWYTGIGYARILINYVLYVGTVTLINFFINLRVTFLSSTATYKEL